MENTKQRGFTLLELLVVIAIIGLLAGIIGVSLSNARVRGRDAKRVGDMKQVMTSLEQYYIKNGYYPTGTASIAGTGTLLDATDVFSGSEDNFVPNYMPFVPKSPGPADGSCLGDAGRGNNNYWYEVNNDGTTYTMTFCLGKDNASWLAGTRAITPDGIN